MSFLPNSMVMGSYPRMNESRTQAVSASAPRILPSILTYCYNSKLVYVTPGETYEQAIDFVQEAFPELRDVDRNLICLEVRVVLNSQPAELGTARICRMAWSPVVASLVQYEIVEIHVESPPAAACSASKPSVAPPPYASEKAGDMEGAPSEVSFDSSPSRQSHPSPCSFTTRIVRLFGQRSSRHPDHSHSS
ncbi:hypothetical protein V8E53_011888 [Lactarius tabidus]